MNNPCFKQYRYGLTQVEVVVSTFIVGVVVVGALEVLGATTRTNRIAAARLDAPALAYQLMGEILALPYEDPELPGGSIGLETGETNSTRADFDDIDDYEGWTSSAPVTRDGTLIPDSTGWQRQVTVKYYDQTDGSTSGSTDTGIKIVEVVVTPTVGAAFKIFALRCKWGSMQQTQGIETTMVTTLDAELQIGSNSQSAKASIHLKNHAND